MIPDVEIYRCAELYVDQHGEDAPLIAAMRADELLAQGSFEGVETYRRIIAAAKELLRTERAGATLQ